MQRHITINRKQLEKSISENTDYNSSSILIDKVKDTNPATYKTRIVNDMLIGNLAQYDYRYSTHIFCLEYTEYNLQEEIEDACKNWTHVDDIPESVIEQFELYSESEYVCKDSEGQWSNVEIDEFECFCEQAIENWKDLVYQFKDLVIVDGYNEEGNQIEITYKVEYI